MPDPSETPRVRTIADLARLAGVSTGTVSRALAGKTLVNEDTRARIQALATAHDFRPNQMASRLRTQKTGVIGIVVPLGHERRQHISDPFFMTMLAQLADSLTESGYDVMLSRVVPQTGDWLERIVDSGMLDGVLIIGQSDQQETIERVAARYRPLVAWGALAPGQIHCSVGVDNREGGRLSAARLIAGGARRIAFLGEIRGPEIRHRWEGVQIAVAAAGLREAPIQIDIPLASDLMESQIASHIDRLRAIDGIAAASDVIAMTAMRVLTDHRISVPGDVKVIGFDDLPIAGQTVPRLTTIRQDIVEGARTMVAALFARMAGEEVAPTVMAPMLVERDSG